jgi:hypothetical protein
MTSVSVFEEAELLCSVNYNFVTGMIIPQRRYHEFPQALEVDQTVSSKVS